MYFCVVAVSAQTSCVISPNITSLVIRGGLVRDIEFHCRCSDDNRQLNEARWFYNGNLILAQNDGNYEDGDPYYIDDDPVALYMDRPFTNYYSGTYTCSPNSTFLTTPPGDNITVTKGSKYVCLYKYACIYMYASICLA